MGEGREKKREGKDKGGDQVRGLAGKQGLKVSGGRIRSLSSQYRNSSFQLGNIGVPSLKWKRFSTVIPFTFI